MSAVIQRPATAASTKPARDFTFIQPAGRRLTEYEALTVHQQPDASGYDMAGGGRFGAEAFLLRSDGGPLWRETSTRLRHPDWYRYRDPAQHWQRTYIRHQEQQETAIERATEDAGLNGTLAALKADWVGQVLSKHWRAWSHFEYAIFRTLCPAQRESLSDTLSSMLCFQSFDHLRHAQDVIVYLVELERYNKAVDDAAGRRAWMEDPCYQPSRHLAEHILNTGDWGELMVGLNLVVGPLLQQLASSAIVRGNAGANGDDVASQIIVTTERDRRRNLAATEAFVRMVTDPALSEAGANHAVICEWIEQWSDYAQKAAKALAPVFDTVPNRRETFDVAYARASADMSAVLSGLGFASAGGT
ncbi:methane monooxygenase component A beta chain/propane monooxygenase small subunit [Panacagrimonas perspica]|uniref:Methane monooxygenase component A beta chain/propane monooxygenase small subunit n=1 Tax=Panacagrimonas perspica TaxID=381431 RepID=A0A4V3F620_9GAMM|nr:monooxygenase [Panacagrimonas perspica]TDU30946.1 methane monooxygenase component A beta chain/propane monooxygenase small subunit [Panacagrimonas perspica]THD01903.1 hypothetical protein B1810_18055 [Panacagrimonas perspica]